MAKRAFDVSEIVQCSPKASISGVVTSISPMKRSRNSTADFFHGSLSDGKSSMRIFGFDSKVRRKLANFEESGESLLLDNCKVKESRLNNDLEILVSPWTEMDKSERHYNIDKALEETDVMTGKEIDLIDIKDLDSFTRITVAAKISGGYI